MNILNEYHMFLLQYMFMSRIQEDLNQYRNIHNNHSIRNEIFKTRLQMLDIHSNTIPPPSQIDLDMYGIDEEMPLDDEDNEFPQQVEILLLHCPLSAEQLVNFRANIVPLNLNENLTDLMLQAGHYKC